MYKKYLSQIGKKKTISDKKNYDSQKINNSPGSPAFTNFDNSQANYLIQIIQQNI